MQRFLKMGAGHSRLFSRQLFLAIFSSSFLLLLCGLIVLHKVSAKSVTDINNEMKQSTLSITGENIDRTLQSVDDTVNMAFIQRNVLSVIYENFSSNPSSATSIRHALATAVASNDAISYMALLDSREGKVETNASKSPFRSCSECIAYCETHTPAYKQGNTTWLFLERNPFLDSYAFANIRKIHLSRDFDREVMLAVYLSESYLASQYDYLGDGNYIATKDGTIISAVNKEMIGDKTDSAILQHMQRGGNRSFWVQEKDDFYFLIYIPTISAYLVANASSEILQTTNHMITVVSILLIAFGLLASLFWAQYISGQLSRPIVALKDTMEQARNGDLSIRSTLNRRDEIGYLSDSFNHMMDSLAQYIAELNRQQALKKESELKLLQTQINPHLLYNTLDSALYLVENSDLHRAAEVLETLSSFFKLSLQSGNKIVPIDKEIEHVAAYIQLQNLCRMKNYTLRFTGETALREKPILHMLLQPVVENAVLHGFEGNFANGTVTIALEEKDGVILIHITDDGIGIDSDGLLRLCKCVDAPEPSGNSFALWNVAERIRMHYGPSYGIEIDSEYGDHTTVTIRIPSENPE